ncbi:hypothetical protein OV203_02610 [Nannocystis sp. ILAH1]|uniref:tyrosine-type recombinase/integrase n=1 Tax=Nannocystis sp. ILAH1 TaxID=2996789 RepID=UPI0022714070|nr:hypothetical protein [Nannocystis sp. ILAH1]MCY0986004.1 hypothetical protein [Nannocystis sp. ILAH1]
MRDYRRMVADLIAAPRYVNEDGESSVVVTCGRCGVLPDSLPPRACLGCYSRKITASCRACGVVLATRDAAAVEDKTLALLLIQTAQDFALPEVCPSCRTVLLLGGLPIADLDPMHVLGLQEWIGEEQGHGTTFNRMKVVISGICKLAETLRHRPAHSNPTVAVLGYKETAHCDSLSLEQRQRLAGAIGRHVLCGDVTRSAGVLMSLMFLAGLRWSDASLLRWDEVKSKRRFVGDKVEEIIYLKLWPRGPKRAKSKGNGAQIPLPPALQELLQSLPRDGEWVAPNPATGLPYDEIDGQRDLIYATAGVKVRGYHGLRHVLGSALGAAGFSLTQISAQLGQRSRKSAERYTQGRDEEQEDKNASFAEAAMLGGKVRDGGGGHDGRLAGDDERRLRTGDGDRGCGVSEVGRPGTVPVAGGVLRRGGGDADPRFSRPR